MPKSKQPPPSRATWNKALRWVRAEHKRRRADSDRYCHPSHTATDVLKGAQTRYGLPTFGVEGWAGVSYLNTGDQYDLTIVCRTTRNSARYSLGCWAEFAPTDDGGQE